jgi:hypothetical protein
MPFVLLSVAVALAIVLSPAPADAARQRWRWIGVFPLRWAGFLLLRDHLRCLVACF